MCLGSHWVLTVYLYCHWQGMNMWDFNTSHPSAQDRLKIRQCTDLSVGWWWWSNHCWLDVGWGSDAGREQLHLEPGRETWRTGPWAAEGCPLVVKPPTARNKQNTINRTGLTTRSTGRVSSGLAILLAYGVRPVKNAEWGGYQTQQHRAASGHHLSWT